ncbi:MAG: D-alanyl-D-alanine carboxypeptidase [Actinomycetota bacterium]|jgi:D-alanyl-D-alanine carboxypeptidase (penicillin-binding protein 5/6)|nr:D-alanyl-D-alanine carboxypeptidase [Actinomycetota bacterium]
MNHVHESRFLRRAIVLFLLLASGVVSLTGRAVAVDRVAGVDVGTTGATSIALPDLSMPAGILVTSDGRELWSRDSNERRAMASTTKIMTAIVVLESAELDEKVSVSAGAASTGESAAGIKAGDTLSVGELLEAMLVKSGNDAAVALAEHIAGGEEAFVEMMNAKTVDLDLQDTHFTNPHGLDDPDHYSTASDLATMARYAMRLDEFARVVGLAETTVSGGDGARTLRNSNELVGGYPGATGIKTGWTNRAGYCLAASAERDEIDLMAIVLGTNSQDRRFIEARRLLDWGFEHFSVRPIASRDDTAGVVAVPDYLDRVVLAVVAEDAFLPVFDADGEVVSRIDLFKEIDAPVARGDRLGTLTVIQGDLLLGQVPIISAYDVEKPGLLERAKITVIRAWRFVFGGAMTAETTVSH